MQSTFQQHRFYTNYLSFLLLSESFITFFVFEAEIAAGFSMVQGLGTTNPHIVHESSILSRILERLNTQFWIS